ncbi:YggT family protein [Clostridium sp.]|uniref:YggT family protein n=1 Tax=Clostridium sp. TaxID=1506 RepID=UPI0039A29283
MGIIRSFLYLLFSVLNLTILAEVILSYVPNINETNFYRILVSLNQPILEPFRRLQEKYFGNMMIDFAPVMAILVINLISGMLL